MNNPYKYRAFGLNIESCVPIPQISPAVFQEADISIISTGLHNLPPEEYKLVGHQSVCFRVDEGYIFRILNGNLIQFDPTESKDPKVLAVYLMGSCMGAILIQRGFMLLHGSCVTDGRRAVLITGNSGAGKSTTAAEFLKRGWKLLTDDVTCISVQDGIPVVQPSYPSQKLWQDTLNHYEKREEDIHSLYFDEDREKFGVNVANSFQDKVCPLSMVVRLLPADHGCMITPIEGIAKVDQLMRNTYRLYFISEQERSRHFQRCVNLAGKLPMALAVRENGKQCAAVLYDLITTYMEEHCHD